MLTDSDKANILYHWAFRPNHEDTTHYPYVWRPGSDDVKIIFAIDDESAARIAVQARIDHNEMSEQEALEHVTTRDLLVKVDPDVFFQGEAPLWDGLRSVADAVERA